MSMNRMTEQERSYKLSLYIDGNLPEPEAKEFEHYLEEHPDAAKELRELRAMKQMLQDKAKLPVSIGFWTRLSVALDRLKAEEHNLLPFPKRFVPLAAALGIVSMVAVGVILFREREPLLEYLSEKTEQVQQVYEGSLLKGAITPLLANIDKDRVLQFALFGTLSLDDKSETALRVDETAQQGYRIEVGKPAEKKIPALTVKEFYDEIKPTLKQEQVIDSLLRLTKKQLESSVLVAENQALAINPSLPELGRVTVSSIAASLEPHQRVRFERFLHARNAPYAVVASQSKAAQPHDVFVKLQNPTRPGRFVILTPETLVVHQLEIDIDSLREEIHRTIPPINVRIDFDRFAQQFRRLKPDQGLVVVGTQPMRVKRNEGSFSIEYETKSEEQPMADDIIRSVRPRSPRPNIYFFQHQIPFVDELMMNDSIVPFGERMDSMIREMQLGRVKSYGPKLDSLIRRMEQRALADSTRVRKLYQERMKRENE